MIRRAFFALVLGGFAALALAHPGHGDPIAQEEAVQRASSQIERLVTAGKLEKSWKMNAKLQKAALAGADEGDERAWMLTFSNETASTKQRTLHLTLSETGEYLAASVVAADGTDSFL